MARRHTFGMTDLTAVLGVAALADAMSPHGKVHRILHARQDASVSDLLGSSEAPPASSEIPELTVTVVPTPANTSATPPIGLSSFSNYTVPSFPTTTVQEPIATVCPGQAANSGIFSILPFPSISTINATALLADGSSTVFSSGVTSTSSPESSISFPPAGPNDARVAIDNSGCQTLFAPRVKGICSTVVSPLGIPEVTVTDCDQYITFSSDTKVCPTILPPTGSPIPLPTPIPSPIPLDGTNTAPSEAASAAPANSPAQQKRDEEDNNSASAFIADGVTAGPDKSILLPHPIASPSQGPGTYYACPWYDAARGGVPPRVRAIECGNDDVVGGGFGCSTFEERWSETSFARTVTETRPVSYSGPVVVTDGSTTYTTTVSIATFTTATTVTFSPTVIKRRLLAAGMEATGAPALGRPDSTVLATSTLTHTEYVGAQTRTVELELAPGESAGAAPEGAVAGA